MIQYLLESKVYYFLKHNDIFFGLFLTMTLMMGSLMVLHPESVIITGGLGIGFLILTYMFGSVWASPKEMRERNSDT